LHFSDVLWGAVGSPHRSTAQSQCRPEPSPLHCTVRPTARPRTVLLLLLELKTKMRPFMDPLVYTMKYELLRYSTVWYSTVVRIFVR
jgi:hypothetical protein